MGIASPDKRQIRAAIALGAITLGYVVFLAFTLSLVSVPVGLLAILPVFLASLWFGIRTTTLVALGLATYHLVLAELLPSAPERLVSSFFANGVLVAAGVTAGWIGKMHHMYREANDRWRAVVDNAPVIIILFDEQRKISFINRGARGFSKDEAIGKPLETYVPEPDRAAVVEAADAVFRGKSSDMKVGALDPGGENRIFHSTYCPVHQGDEVACGLLITSEITDQARFEDIRNRFVEGVVTAQEEERARIALELHDGLGQSLTSVLMRLRILADSANGSSDAVEEIRDVTRGALEDLHRLAQGLHPIALEDLGFEAALNALCNEFMTVHGCRVDIETRGIKLIDVPVTLQLSLYRIIQEALSNVARHSGATAASVIVERSAGTVRLIIEDDGSGFEMDEHAGVATDNRGLGLVGIRERAALHGGSVTIESSPGQGTAIYVRVPEPAEAVAEGNG